MSPPPTPLTTPPPAPSSNLPAPGEIHRRRSRVLMREAAQLSDELGWTISPAKLRIVVGAYLSHVGIRPDDEEAAFRGWFLSYADPTGEEACRRAMRRAG